MERIAIDTIGLLPNDMCFKCIIDTFTRYVELFPKQEVSAIAAADALWRHTCRFTAPLEIVTDFGSQFMNQLLTHFNAETGIKHHTTIPKERKIVLSNGRIRRLIAKFVTFCLTKVTLKTGSAYCV